MTIQEFAIFSLFSSLVNDKVGQAFTQAANEAELRVAGMPRISEKDSAAEGGVAFDAVFEVYPEVVVGDLAEVEVERVTSEVTDAAIDRTLDILRKQRRSFADRAADEVATDDDRVTIDFEGKIDGETFAGGKAEGFQFILGEGRMLEQFEKEVRGMKAGESKKFPLAFPEDYHGKDVAGKEADFLVTLTKIEGQQLPAVDAEFAQPLGIADATVEGLRADIRKNLEREVKFRVAARNKQAVMAALEKATSFVLPKALVDNELERLVAGAREVGGTSVVPEQVENGSLVVWFKPQGDGQWIGEVPGLEGIEDLFAVTDLAIIRLLRCRASSRRLLEQSLRERPSR